MASIRLRGLRKTYPDGEEAVRGLDLDVADGELLVLVGPSGCGKTSTLRMVAGLESPSAGSIHIGDDDVTAMPPGRRDVAMVFQSYALYPHMTVRDNLAFPLRMRREPRPAIARRVEQVAALLDLQRLLQERPGRLSGGQRQRVALGRAMVREPRVFLLDEPLSNLDAALRVRTRTELQRMHRRLGATMLYVTHDQEEAMTLGDRIAVMERGRLQQVAPPLEVYRRPANLFVARFIGSPAMNLFPCRLRRAQGTTLLQGGPLRIELDAPAARDDRDLLLGIRPHDLQLVDPGAADLAGTVELLQPRGADLLLHVAVQGKAGEESGEETGREPAREPVRVLLPAETRCAAGATVGLRLRRDRLHLFDAGSGDRLT
jgi:ABC-type sugar transport system ATPase subunit